MTTGKPRWRKPDSRRPDPIDRRGFLAKSVALAAGGVLGSMVGGCAAPGAGRTVWTLGCYTRPWDQHDYRVALDAMAEAGFAHAGIMTAKGRSWVMITAETTPEEAAEIGNQVRLRGLKTASVYGDYRPTERVADNLGSLERLIGHCRACGSSDLLLGGVGDDRLAGAYYEAIREACPAARAQGVRLTLKPHGGRIATGPQCREVIESVDQPNFRLWYDPGNIFYYSDGTLDPVDDARSVGGWVVGMSIKDFLPPKQVDVTPGAGRVDFAAVLATLRQGGFRGGPLVVECVARPDPADVRAITSEARRAREFVEALIASA